MLCSVRRSALRIQGYRSSNSFHTAFQSKNLFAEVGIDSPACNGSLRPQDCTYENDLEYERKNRSPVALRWKDGRGSEQSCEQKTCKGFVRSEAQSWLWA